MTLMHQHLFLHNKRKGPKHKFASYGHIACNYHLQKDKPHQTHLTIGNDRITYTGNKSTPMADLVTAKPLINSTISTPNTCFYGIDLANFYLMMPMPDFEYMRLRLDVILDEIIAMYNLHNLVDNQGWVYVEIRMGMYSLLPGFLPTNSSKNASTRRFIPVSAHPWPLVTRVVQHHILPCHQ